MKVDNIHDWMQMYSDYVRMGMATIKKRLCTVPILVFSIWIISLSYRLYLTLSFFSHYHADEFFQSLEIAHDIVYGFGYIAPEYQETHAIESYARLRSFIFPYFFVAIFELGEFLNLNYYTVTLPLARSTFTVLTSTIIPLTYLIVKRMTKNRNYAIASTLVVAFDYEMITMGIHTIVNSFVTPFVLFGFYLYLLNKDKSRTIGDLFSLSGIFRVFLLIFVGILFGLTTYIRIDTIAFIGLLMLFELRPKNFLPIALIFLGGITGLLIGGYIDYLTWGDFFISPMQWFRFNILEGHSAMFGVSPFYYYYASIFVLRPWFAIGVILTLIYVGTEIYDRSQMGEILPLIYDGTEKYNRPYPQIKGLSSISKNPLLSFQIRLIIMFIALSIPYSLVGHKELRFFYHGYWMFALLTATGYLLIAEKIWKTYLSVKLANQSETKTESQQQEKSIASVESNHEEKGKGEIKQNRIKYTRSYLTKKYRIMAKKSVFWLVILVAYMGLISSVFAAEVAVYEVKIDRELFDDYSEAFRRIGMDGNVTGILVVGQWYWTAHSTLLHKNVTITFFYRGSYEATLPRLLRSPTYDWFIVPGWEIGQNASLEEVVNTTVPYYNFELQFQIRELQVYKRM